MLPRLPHVLSMLIGIALLAACPAETAEEPDLVATQVAVELAVAATLTAEAAANAPTEEPTATPTSVPPTAAPADTATPTTDAPTATVAPPTPTPTQIVAVIFPVDGSDPDGNQALHGSFIQSNSGRNVVLPGIPQSAVSDPMVFHERLPVRVEVFDDTVDNRDGAGIAAVDFAIDGPEGDPVLRTVEEMAPYCLWTGNDPACPAPSFAELDYRWPQTGGPIEDGSHSATIVITATDNSTATWFWTFEIDHDGAAYGDGEAAAPVELVLRPACGNNLTVPANTPIDLIYGIWASRGYDRAAANEPDVVIELTIDGQTISGQRVNAPVADLPEAICGSDYENSYWVYEAVRLDPLAPGAHNVHVTYRFSETIEDGYGGRYIQPFTQQYVIDVE